MDKTWILIADAHRARCFERQSPNETLVELADFVCPQLDLATIAAGGDLTGATGKGHGRTGHAGTQFEPHTEVHTKERESFARQLADYLNQGSEAQRYYSLALIVTSPMLGHIRPNLGPATAKAVTRCVVSDLTHFCGPELLERVNHALAFPD